VSSRSEFDMKHYGFILLYVAIGMQFPLATDRVEIALITGFVLLTMMMPC
jgi:hypothetical protein